MPERICAITRAGPETMNIGDAMTGRRSRDRMAGIGMADVQISVGAN
jgi:hypothetical protein